MSDAYIFLYADLPYPWPTMRITGGFMIVSFLPCPAVRSGWISSGVS